MTPMSRRLGFALILATLGSAGADEPLTVESIEPTAGHRVVGRVVGDALTGFRFQPTAGGDPIPLATLRQVQFSGPKLPPGIIPPPFRVELGLSQRISGRLESVDDQGIRLQDGPGGQMLTIRRPGATSVLQRAGEVQVLADPFERIETGRWTRVGLPDVVDQPHLEGLKSLALPGEGASLATKLEDPISAGRLDLAFFDDGKIAPGHSATVELVFRGQTGPATIRAILGWDEESLAVQSLGGTALSVQRLARRPGWHRLTIEFGPENTLLSVDGDVLAKGRGTGGPLSELRLVTSSEKQDAGMPGLVAHFDDLRLIRFADVVPGVELDPHQDEARTVVGDQIFGKVQSANPAGIVFAVDGKNFGLGWSEVAGLLFKRDAAQGSPIDGLLVRVRWRIGPGEAPNDLDEVEGALSQLTDSTLSLATPFAGTLNIPRNRLAGLLVLGKGRRVVIDGTSHHLGNEVTKRPPLLDPPQPEGGTLERSFTLESIPSGDAFVVLDVVQVVGDSGNSRFSYIVKKGEMRTWVLVNGKHIDDLNRHIFDENERPERIRLPIPAGLLQTGQNTIRLEQQGQIREPNEFDDLGVLTMAIEFIPPKP